MRERILRIVQSRKHESILRALTMSPLSNLQLDEIILSVTEPSWRKVALVIVRVANIVGGELPEGDACHNLVAKRIEILVGDGRLLAQGDIKEWRHSEVKKPN